MQFLQNTTIESEWLNQEVFKFFKDSDLHDYDIYGYFDDLRIFADFLQREARISFDLNDRTGRVPAFLNAPIVQNENIQNFIDKNLYKENLDNLLDETKKEMKEEFTNQLNDLQRQFEALPMDNISRKSTLQEQAKLFLFVWLFQILPKYARMTKCNKKY